MTSIFQTIWGTMAASSSMNIVLFVRSLAADDLCLQSGDAYYYRLCELRREPFLCSVYLFYLRILYIVRELRHVGAYAFQSRQVVLFYGIVYNSLKSLAYSSMLMIREQGASTPCIPIISFHGKWRCKLRLWWRNR